MDRQQLTSCLESLNDELKAADLKGEVCLYGGAAMCLVYQARPSTKDVDAVFRPAAEIRQAARRVAEKNGLPEDWLNDAVKGYLAPHEQRLFLDLSHLKIFVPEADYLLAMKALAARVDTEDRRDVETLIASLGLKAPEDVLSRVEKYYPHSRIRPAVRFFIEEIFQK